MDDLLAALDTFERRVTEVLNGKYSDALAALRATGVLPAVDPMEELARETWINAGKAFLRNAAVDDAHMKAATAIIATALRSVARPSYTDEELQEWVDKVIFAFDEKSGWGPAIAVLREMLEGKG